MHDAGFLREAHTLDRQEEFAVQALQGGGLLEDILYDLWLDPLEVYHSSKHWERWLPVIVERFHFVERSEGATLLSLVELLIETELVLGREDAIREGHRLAALLGTPISLLVLLLMRMAVHALIHLSLTVHEMTVPCSPILSVALEDVTVADTARLTFCLDVWC